MEDVVVVARLDASLWKDDAATMRAKLAPPGLTICANRNSGIQAAWLLTARRTVDQQT